MNLFNKLVDVIARINALITPYTLLGKYAVDDISEFAGDNGS